MLIHHLTIVLTKFLFVTMKNEAVWVDKGLNPLDAEEYGLIPLITLTLGVGKVGVYHQQVHLTTKKICLATFLHDAWLNIPELGGLPDELCVDQQLLEDYPLLDVLKQIDPTGHIKRISPNPGRSFNSSKGQANRQVRGALDYVGQIEPDQPKLPEGLLSFMNANLKQTLHTSLMGLYGGSHAFLQAVEEHNRRHPNKPEASPPSPVYRFFDAGWVRSTAQAIPKLKPSQILITDAEPGWIKHLRIGYDSDIENDDESEEITLTNSGDEKFWITDTHGFKEVISALPYSFEPDNGLKNESLKGFLAGREALARWELEILEKSLADQPKVLWVRSMVGLRAAYIRITDGGAERSFELLGGSDVHSQFRVLALIDDDGDLILVVIPRASKADVPQLEKTLQIRGSLDVGPAGFAAIEFWLVNFVKDCHPSNSAAFLRMVRAMLKSLGE